MRKFILLKASFEEVSALKSHKRLAVEWAGEIPDSSFFQNIYYFSKKIKELYFSKSNYLRTRSLSQEDSGSGRLSKKEAFRLNLSAALQILKYEALDMRRNKLSYDSMIFLVEGVMKYLSS